MIKQYENELSKEDLNDLGDYLHYLFTEMLNNVPDHSNSQIGGFAMAQYYPTYKKIQFAISDRGIGFLENVKRKDTNAKTEAEAIKRAIEKGFTATAPQVYNQEKNSGFGLYAMSNIIKEIGGTFVIISNNIICCIDITTKIIKKR